MSDDNEKYVIREMYRERIDEPFSILDAWYNKNDLMSYRPFTTPEINEAKVFYDLGTALTTANNINHARLREYGPTLHTMYIVEEYHEELETV